MHDNAIDEIVVFCESEKTEIEIEIESGAKFLPVTIVAMCSF